MNYCCWQAEYLYRMLLREYDSPLKELATTRKYSSPRLKNSQSTALEIERKVCHNDVRTKWLKKKFLNRICSPNLCRAVGTSVPVSENILKADKQLCIHVQFIDSGVDGVLTWSVTIESVSIGNNQEDSTANLEHFPVCGTICLHWQQEKNRFVCLQSEVFKTQLFNTESSF